MKMIRYGVPLTGPCHIYKLEQMVHSDGYIFTIFFDCLCCSRRRHMSKTFLKYDVSISVYDDFFLS